MSSSSSLVGKKRAPPPLADEEDSLVADAAAPYSFSMADDEDVSWFRAKIRKALLPRIEAEVEFVARVQKYRTPFLDAYNKTWSIFGTHVCYMIGLPLLCWFGFSHFSRHQTFLMAFGLIVCSVIKDYLWLPRPRTPPVVRLSDTHNLEFGFPSSHSVNALTFPLFSAIYYVMYHDGPLRMLQWAALVVGCVVVVSSISFSRIYCGMHCPTDVLGGFAVGTVLLSLSLYYMSAIDQWVYYGDNVMLYSSIVMIIFLWAYPNPAYSTPSFDDSIAFAFVVIGYIAGTRRLAQDPLPGTRYEGDVPFSYAEAGPVVALLRVVVGIAFILLWRLAAKAFCKLVFPPLFKYFDYEHSFRKKRVGGTKPYEFPRFNAEVATKGVVYLGIAWIASDVGGTLMHAIGL